jgi:type I restriction enzyme S subunit
MSSDWRETTLGEFIRLQRGHDLTATEQKPGKVPIMGSAGPNGTHSTARASGPGVAVGRSGGSAGRVHFSEVDYWPHNTCLYVTDFLGNNPRYCYYLLQTLKLASFNSGSAQASINRNFLYPIKLRVPERPVQDRIATLLQSIDHSITTARQTNGALESIAQTLFRSWFVDFDPVHAKLAGKEPEAMSPELAALFPTQFEESELGLIPKGWAVTTFGAAFDIKGGGTPSTKEASYWDNGTHSWATPKDMSNLASKVIYQTAFKLTAAGVNKISSKVLPVGTTLMSSRAPVGYLAIAKAPISINQGFIAIPPTEGLPSSFIVNLLLHKMPEIKANAGGTTFAEISKSQFRPIKWVRSSKKVIDAFGRIAEPLYAAVHANCLTIDALADLRDHLLPRLISGKLRLEDAEASVAAITSELEAEPA